MGVNVSSNESPNWWVIAIVVCVFGVMILVASLLPEIPTYLPCKGHKYIVEVSNWIGGESYCCDSYVKEGNVYKLFGRDSSLVSEIIITDGYYLSIKSVNE